jgi:hypothetical protein
MSDFKNTSITNTKVEQLVIERFMKLSLFDDYAEVDSNELKVWKAKKWRDAFGYKEYDINSLLREGWTIKSVTKSFATTNRATRFGIETVILERETK